MDVPRSTLVVISNSACIEAEKGHKLQLSFICHGIKVCRTEQQDLQYLKITSCEGMDSLKQASGSTNITSSTSKASACPRDFQLRNCWACSCHPDCVWSLKRIYSCLLSSGGDKQGSFSFSFFFSLQNFSHWVALTTDTSFLNPLLFSRWGS